MRNHETPVGQNLNFKGPVGRADTRSRFCVWLDSTDKLREMS